MRYRIERDALGERQVPAEAYYGIQTLRAKENFEITKRGICRQMIKSLAIVKKACAKANCDAGMISEENARVIMLSCDEILNGRLHGQFITDLIQGGAGTSMNMNANEVIANRANEMLGGKKGEYQFVHPIDDLNCGQSTNDVIPTAGKIAIIKQLKKLSVELKKFVNCLSSKAKELDDVIKIGKTHLEDALPIRMGQQFSAMASVLTRDLKRIDNAIDALSEINMGATAIGTGLNANAKYSKKVVTYLTKFSGETLKTAKDLIDSTRSLDCYVVTSSVLKILAVNLSKIANDIRLMASSNFNEITLPHVQPGSSIIPGKFNPVIPEVVNQVSFYVIGLDATITKAVEAGQLELNVFQPVILMSLFDQLSSLRRGIRTFNELAVSGITANVEQCKAGLNSINTQVTALSPHIGFEKACAIAKEAIESKKSIKDIVIANGLLSKDDVETILDIENLVNSGISGEELLEKKIIK